EPVAGGPAGDPGRGVRRPVRDHAARLRDGSGRRRAGPARRRVGRPGRHHRRTTGAARGRRGGMSLLVTASVSVAVPAADAWRAVVDWAGQGRCIPFTTVRVTAGPATGLGCRVEALSGFRAAGRPIGLLDRFVVAGWTPPAPDRPGEVEVLHLGPGFTGVGVIRVVSVAAGSIVAVTESFDPPGG